MEIVKAELIGFCMGVRRAVELAYKVIEDYKGSKIYTLGPIIHNPSVVEELRGKGVNVLDSDFSVLDSDSVVIIRAHGVAPDELAQIEASGATVIDATCPRVLRSKQIVEANVASGKSVVLVGDKDHGEVKAVSGHSDKVVVLDPHLDYSVALDVKVPVVLVAQTTIKHDEFYKVYEFLKQEYSDVEIVDTICPSTEKRQEALLDLIGKVDAVVVIGGKNSANTRRLAMTVEDSGLPVFYIETEDELSSDILNYNRVGIAAGASTPDNVIDSVVCRLVDIGGCYE
ncbi:MAG: 4-hydroxy-3-methylbut-2-enyl diphosphate reductase [Spirochaetales bacterium]|nr:4-hydroxy-3-methylbut-2-enyl diphosphate reductase [Spirochaetales bacterium]